MTDEQNGAPPNAEAIRNQAESEGRAVYMVLGGDLVRPAAYRSQLETSWRAAVNGSGSISNHVLTGAYGSSGVAFAASNYRAQAVSDIPNMIADPQKQKVDAHPFQFFLETAPTLYWYIEMGLIIWGVAYLRKWYNEYNFPVALEWIHPDDVQPQTDIDNNVECYYIMGIRHSKSEVVEIRTFDPERSLNGKSEFEVALLDITTDQSLGRHAGSFFFNAARPDGMLISKTPLNDADRRQAEADWKKFKEAKNAWKTFVSSAEWQWIPLSAPPVDLAMPELTAQTRRDICVIMGVNPALIGAADASDPLSAGATFREIKRDHIENKTLPRHAFICQALNEQWLHTDFPRRNYYNLTADKSAMAILSDVTTDRATIASQLTQPANPIVTYNEARSFMSLPEIKDYFTRNPAEAAAVWKETGISLDEFRFFIGLKPLPLNNGTVYRLPSGMLIPAELLRAHAQKNYDAPPPAPGNFGGGSGFGLAYFPSPGNGGQPPPMPSIPPSAPTPPTLPSGGAPLLRIRTVRNDGETGKAAILLSLEGNPQIAAIQTLLKARIGVIEGYEWTEPPDFHITLLYCDNLEREKETEFYPLLDGLNPLVIEITELSTFENEDIAVVLMAKVSDELAALQEKLYKKAEALGATLSEFSDPAHYNPHVTLCYAPLGAYTAPDGFPVQITVSPTAVVISREVYEHTHKAPLEIPAEILETARGGVIESYTWDIGQGTQIGGSLPPVRQRAPVAVEFAAVWPENNFILMAQRMAARELTESGITAVEWYPDSAWRLPLASINGVSPGEAAQMLRAITLDESPRIDLYGAGLTAVNGEIGLRIQANENLDKLRAALALELEDSGYTPSQPGLYIPLGSLGGDLDAAQIAGLFTQPIDGATFPLVAGNITMLVNGESRAVWNLRNSSPAQRDELNQWLRKASGRRGASAPFETRALTGTLAEAFLRHALPEIEESDKDSVRGLFARAQQILVNGLEYRDELPPAPEEFRDYWEEYDTLQTDIGRDWLAYMDSAESAVMESLEDSADVANILGVMSKYHAQLADSWVGTPDQPGDLTALIMAGMAAGNSALTHETSMNPETRASAPFGAQGLTIDWQLMSQQALDFARSYSYKLIRGIDETTQKAVQTALSEWIQSGEPLPALKTSLTAIFKDAKRAQVIAQTESIRTYNEGAFERWRQVGVKRAVWRTVQDNKVCAICRPLNGQVADFDGGWVHPGGTFIEDGQPFDGSAYRGKTFRASAHTGCRCFRRPLVESLEPPKGEKVKPGEKAKVKPGEATPSPTTFTGRKLTEYINELAAEFEPVRAKLLQADKDHRKRLKALNKQDGELETGLGERYRAALRAYGRTDWSHEESESDLALRAEMVLLESQYADEKDRIRKAYEDNRKANEANIIKALGTSDPYEVKTLEAGAAKFKKETRTKHQDAREWLGSVMDGKAYEGGLTVPINKLPKGSRAYHLQGQIYLDESDTTSTVIHEIGHAIEYKYPDVANRCEEFLRYRQGNEKPRKLSELTNSQSYGLDEIAVKDQFKHAYMGKLYLQGNYIRATEILSMGLEEFYRNPLEFAKDDPEYFNFILSILRRMT